MAQPSYQLGIDLGTTYTAAAIGRDGHVEVCTLGSASTVIPTVVLLRDNGEVLVGEPAARRGAAEPARLAREFKRRLGDPTPLVLGGTPFGADALMGHVLRAVMKTVSEREGDTPGSVVLTHPATYGPYKVEMMEGVARQAGIDLATLRLLTEPEAAAMSYASRNRVEPGEIVGVYDFGGGTLDTALVQRDDDRFRLIGRPEGMERFGGIDIDAAVMSYIDDELDGAVSALDAADPAVQAAVARLRDDCRSAKETLSTDSDATITVAAPGLQHSVTLTRAHLDRIIRPRLRETVDTLRRMLVHAGLSMDQVSRFLLVGGSAQIPLVAETIRTETGRPVALDAHPKFAVAMGAAGLAPRLPLAGATRTRATPTVTPAPTAVPPAPDHPVPPPASPPVPAPAGSPGRDRRVIGGLFAAAAAATIAIVVALSGGGGTSSPSTIPPGTATPAATDAPRGSSPSPSAVPTVLDTKPTLISSADAISSLLTPGELGGGWVQTGNGTAGSALCGVEAEAPNPGVQRSFGRGLNTANAQSLFNTVLVFRTAEQARAVLDSQIDTLTNVCPGFVVSTPQGAASLQVTVLSVPKSVTAQLPPACTQHVAFEQRQVLQATGATLDISEIEVVRCANVLVGVNVVIFPTGQLADSIPELNRVTPLAAAKVAALPLSN